MGEFYPGGIIYLDMSKRFIVLGNMNAVTCKEIFPLIKDNKMWYGVSISSGDREFRIPDDYPLKAAGSRVDESGNKFIRVKGVRWFTNLDHSKRHHKMDFNKSWQRDSMEYPHYDNYDAIEVSKACNIPMGYTGVMGLPITFLDKYCPEQFEILWMTSPDINGQKLYKRVFIRFR